MARQVSPTELADVVLALDRPVLVGLDVDGVLSPIVEHADDARLLDGTDDLLHRLSAAAEVRLAVVSGRSVADLERRFAFPASIDVIGSHGLERRGRPEIELDAVEHDRLRRAGELVAEAAAMAGPGAWLERKPASVVLHVRSADAARGEAARAWLLGAAAALDGVQVTPGSAVVELLVRRGDKGAALIALAAELATASTVFLGDDVTDEIAFSRLGGAACTVLVGDRPTGARYRLDDPFAVRTWLGVLAARLGG